MSSEMTGEAEEMKDDEEEMKDRYDDDGGDEGFSVLSDLPVEITERRPTCHTCW